jgi:hypothetical protein
VSRHARPSLLDTFARCSALAAAAAAAAAERTPLAPLAPGPVAPLAPLAPGPVAPLAPLAPGPVAVNTAALGPPLSDRERDLLSGFGPLALARIERTLQRLRPEVPRPRLAALLAQPSAPPNTRRRRVAPSCGRSGPDYD